MNIPGWLRGVYQEPYEGAGFAPLLWLLYLGFLFVPLGWKQEGWRWLWLTLPTVPVFLAIYMRHLRPCGRTTVAQVLAIACLCYALLPFNIFANTYMAFAAALSPLALAGTVPPLLLGGTLMAIYALEVLLLGQAPANIFITLMIVLVAGIGSAFGDAVRRKNAVLKISQEEVRRLATIAERERIGRDLHDLLGHTLSLVALKGELAGKLVSRDPEGAQREIGEVTQIAREALAQVRTAVTGMRSAALAGELAAARTLLESCGVELSCHQETSALSPPLETALAMIVREAATNIQRHARATRASVEIREDAGSGGEAVALRVSDNGRGGVATRGNGLSGISERVRSLGGTLEIESPPGAGTVLNARLPVLQ